MHGRKVAAARRLSLALAGALAVAAPGAAAADAFDAWLDAFRREAASEGIGARTLDRALAGLRPIDRVVRLDRRQPEGRMTFGTYGDRVLSAARVAEGRRLLDLHADDLRATGERYGVPPRVIVALWGLESNYGGQTGGFPVIDALATLAYDGRRAAFFRGELLNALRILDRGNVSPDAMTGSWAGAMGQAQFMPSAYLDHAEDADGDGRADIWASRPDVFASIANYLNQAGWRSDWRWGRAVRVPDDLPEGVVGLGTEKPLSEWRRLGVTRPDGGPLPTADLTASLIIPDPGGDAFLAYDNFRVFMRWNRSTYFALTAGLLSDRIGDG